MPNLPSTAAPKTAATTNSLPVIRTASTNAKAAASWASSGFPVFPCRAGGDREKAPLTKSGFKDASIQLDRIRSWWQRDPQSIVGIPTGEASGFWVLDVDGEPGRESLQKLIADHGPIPETATVRTANGGYHYYWRNWQSVPKCTAGFQPGLDVRSGGGYVIAPGSVMADGKRRYEWASDCRMIADAPEWLVSCASRADKTDTHTGTQMPTQASAAATVGIKHPPKYYAVAIARAVAAVANAPVHERNVTLNIQAYSLAGIPGIDQAQVFDALTAAAVDAGLSPEEIPKTLRSGWSRGVNRPRDIAHKPMPASKKASIPTTHPTAGEWPEPVPLDTHTLPAWPLDTFPPHIERYTRALANATETPIELASGMALACLSAACHGKIAVQARPGWIEPLNLWVMAALPSGSGKSQVLGPCMRPLSDWESDRRDSMAHEIAKASNDRKVISARIAKLQKDAANAESDAERFEISSAILKLEESMPPEKQPPRVWADDATPERLAGLMHEHSERMALLTDEDTVFAQMLGLYNNGRFNGSLYLKGFTGSPCRVDRKNGPPIMLDSPSLVLGMAVQPAILQRAAETPLLRDTGMLSRFIYLVPPSLIGSRTHRTQPVPDDCSRAWGDTLRALLDLPSGKAPVVVYLQDDAHQAWQSFTDEIESSLARGNDLEHLGDWGSKLISHCLRIAGVLHVADAIDTAEHGWPAISLKTMASAISICRTLIPHALAAFDLVSTDPSRARALEILEWIRANNLEQFIQTDLLRRFRKWKASDVTPPLELLIPTGYLCPEPPLPDAKANRRGYLVNPKWLAS